MLKIKHLVITLAALTLSASTSFLFSPNVQAIMFPELPEYCSAWISFDFASNTAYCQEIPQPCPEGKKCGKPMSNCGGGVCSVPIN